jgi:hypothetical protein
MVPQEGGISTILQMPVVEGLRLFKMTSTGEWELKATYAPEGWLPLEPSVRPGEGFRLDPPSSLIWERVFYVNPENVPAFVAPPADQVAASGSDVVFEALAVAPADLRYQWQKDGHDLRAAVVPTLRLNQVTPRDAGMYWVSAYTEKGWARSRLAQLGVQVDSNIRINWRSLPEGLQISLNGPTGVPVDLEGSVDLKNWSVQYEGLEMPGSATVRYEHLVGRRFFRAVRR